MYWFNSSKLADDFREGRVDERERFKYYLASLIAWSVVVQVLIFSGTVLDVESLVSAGANLIVIVVGTVLCYRVNRRGDDKDFIPRMICLGWPVGVKWTLCLLALFIFSVWFYALLKCLYPLPVGGISAGLFISKVAVYTEKFWGYFIGVLFLLPYFQYIHGGFTLITHSRAETQTTELGKQRLRESPGGGTQNLGRFSDGPDGLKNLALGCLGGIGFILLVLAGVVVIHSLGLPTRLEILLLVGSAFSMSWLMTRLVKWEKARAQRKSA